MTLQGALAVRPRLELFPRGDGRPVAVPAERRSLSTRRDGVHSYNDITPRGGVAIDLFGTGKTSLKVNVGKYLQAAQNGLAYGALRPSRPADDQRRRATGPIANGDFVPDCDLLNPLAQIDHGRCLRADQPRWTSASDVFTSDLDPALRSGWGVRPATGSSASRSSRNCCRASRSRSATTAAG